MCNLNYLGPSGLQPTVKVNPVIVNDSDSEDDDEYSIDTSANWNGRDDGDHFADEGKKSAPLLCEGTGECYSWSADCLYISLSRALAGILPEHYQDVTCPLNILCSVVQ